MWSMRKRRLILTLPLLAAILLWAPAVGAMPDAQATLEISEIRIDQPGSDVDEYFELSGPPGSLDGLTYLVIGDSSAGSGVIEAVVDLSAHAIPGSGYFVAAESSFSLGTANLTTSLNFENNDNVTHMLVRDFSGANGDDLDGDDDGTLDVTPWAEIVDWVSLVETPGSGDHYYSPKTVGPDGSFVPAHVFRCPGSWEIGDFDPSGGQDTPGAANPCGGPPEPAPTPSVPLVSIQDIQTTSDPGGDSPFVGQVVTTRGVVTAFFYAGGDRLTFIQDGEGPWSGLMLFRPNGFVDLGDLVEVTGEVSEFFGLTEIAFGDVTVLSSGNPLPAPKVLPTGSMAQEQWESVLVRVEDVVVINDDLGFGEWLVDDGSGGARVDDLGNCSYAPASGDTLAYVQGPLHFSFGNFKIEPRDDGDILPSVTIMQIQGDGQFSPFEGQIVQTSGVVTAITASGRDFWIQDPNGDGDPDTSDGIFVDDRDRLPDPKPQVGDLVVVTGQVEELQFGAALPLTRIDDPHKYEFEILSTENPLPPVIPITDLPDESIPDAIGFWEPLEGMLVSVENGFVVGPTSRFGEFAMITETDAEPGSGYYPQTKQILIRSTGPNAVDYNPERVLVDDSTLEDPIVVKPGDRVRSLTGVVDYTFGNYKLQPVEYDVKTHKLAKVPVSDRSGPKGDLVITTFNVENLFDLVDNPDKDDQGSTPSPEELEVQLTKLALAIEIELELPEIIVVQEVENQEIAQVLADRVNAAAGTNYQAVSFETSDGRGIEPGFLWDADRVTLVDAYQLTDAIMPGVAAAFGPSSPSPGREPIVGVFEVDGREIIIVGNHFKSKGGDEPLFGVNWPPDRITEAQRKAQARVVREFVNAILDADPDAWVLVAGDLNDFPFAEPGEGADHPLAILEGGPGEVPLANLVWEEKAAERFTYIFDGNSQVLDHMLASPAMREVLRGVDILHFNASYPDGLGEDPSTALRASDHDPLEARFRLK